MLKKLSVKTILGCALLLIFSNSNAQNSNIDNYYKDLYFAIEKLKTEKDTNNIIEFYRKCLTEYKEYTAATAFNYANAINICHNKDRPMAYEFFKLAMLQGYDSATIDFVLNNKLKRLHHDSGLINLASNLSKYRAHYLSKINSDKLIKLTLIMDRDQFIRRPEFETDCNPQILTKVDSINTIALFNYFEDYGFPAFQDIGVTVPYYVVFLHVFSYEHSTTLPNSMNSFEYFNKILYQATLDGHFWNQTYAGLVDRSITLYHPDRRPMYSILDADKNNNQIIELVNNARQKIYLPPLEKDSMISEFIYN